MRKAQDLFDISECKELHEKVLFLLKDYYKEEKEYLKNMFEGFVDRDNKIVKQFQETFHSTLWEIYIYSILKEMNFNIDWNHEHPDFVISAPEIFYIEAVTSNKRNAEDHNYNDGKGGVEEITKGYIDPKDYDMLMREAISRNYYKVRDKLGCYRDKYSKNDWLDKNSPYVVALGSYSQEGYGREYIYPLIALLYGKYFEPSSNNFHETSFIIRPEEKKDNEKIDIPLGIFLKEEYSDISAIIYSASVSLGKLSALSATNKNIVHVLYDGDERDPFSITSEYKEKLTDGLFIFHNPLAKSPLPRSIFTYENINQFSIDGFGNLKSTIPNGHLVGRAVFCTEDKYDPCNADKLDFVNKCEKLMVEELKAKANLNFNLYSRKNFYDKKLKEVLDK
ncbi:hypothetical protein PU708_000013525 [Morganella morganii]|nr:hypothetical protein [Morganella morganii]EKW7747711.1 hypothetical protein [Morganella morganii]HCR3201308.1 hypothetical protein [Morganella morganii]HCT8187546.1 hypothetical protein [Morganella morganii]